MEMMTRKEILLLAREELYREGTSLAERYIKGPFYDYKHRDIAAMLMRTHEKIDWLTAEIEKEKDSEETSA